MVFASAIAVYSGLVMVFWQSVYTISTIVIGGAFTVVIIRYFYKKYKK